LGDYLDSSRFLTQLPPFIPVASISRELAFGSTTGQSRIVTSQTIQMDNARFFEKSEIFLNSETQSSSRKANDLLVQNEMINDSVLSDDQR
jgi:hypothetical protein